MGLKLERKKQFNGWLSLAYRLKKILPLSQKWKLKLFLDLEWTFARFAHEASFKLYAIEDHPVRKFTKQFLLQNLSANQTVLDLGCKQGELSNMIAEKVKTVIGIDHDGRAIQTAKTKFLRDNLCFVEAEAYQYLSGQNQVFDVLILSHILEHLDEPESFLLSFKQFFKFIFIEVPDFDSSYLNHYRKDFKNSLIYSDNDHVSEFDRIELKELLLECGFIVLKEEYRFGVQRLWCKVN